MGMRDAETTDTGLVNRAPGVSTQENWCTEFKYKCKILPFYNNV